MITNYKEDIFWGARYKRDEKTGELKVNIVSGFNLNPVCTLNTSRDDWEFNSMLMIHMSSAFEIVRRIALDDVDEGDAVEIREEARRINEILQEEHDKLKDQ